MTLYEVVINGMLDSEPMKTVLHYDITGSTDLQAFVDGIYDEMIDLLNDLIVPSASWDGCTLREVIPGAIGVPYQFTLGDVVGINAQGSYNARTAANVVKLTGSSVKPTQGRIYQSGIPISALNDNGFLLSTYQSDLAAAWEELRVINFDGTGEGVMHILASNPTAPNTQVSTVVSSFTVKGRTSIQSRRNFNTP